MTTIDTAPQAATGAGSSRVVNAVGEWITTSDHKRIGRLLVGFGLLALIGIAVVGALLGFERIDTDSVQLDAGSITQLFALHRIGLVFFVLLPVMFGIAVAIVPLQLGARSLAFPRLAAAGFWGWLLGMILVLISILANGGPGGGATKFVALFIASYGVMLAGLTAIAISLATTVLTTRAPGMNMRRIPFYSWSVLVSALGSVIVLPITIGAVIYVYVSYRYDRLPYGGNEGIMSWLGFSVSQPATFLFAMTAIGFLAEMIPVTARNRMPMRGVVLGGLGLIGVSAFGAATQSHISLPWSGSKLYVRDIFGEKLFELATYGLLLGLPLLGAVVVLLIGPLAFQGGKPKINAAFVFGFFGTGMILVGMAGTLLEGIVDLGLAGTVFEEGALTYVVYGALLAAMGAVTYWGPKLTGRSISDKAVGPLALLGVGATIAASLPYYVAGFADQPAGAVSFDYGGPQELWNTLVAIGHAGMAVTVLAFIGLALKSFRSGRPVGDDPWNGQTLEWATTSPPPLDNFVEMHTISSAEPLLDLKSPRNA